MRLTVSERRLRWNVLKKNQKSFKSHFIQKHVASLVPFTSWEFVRFFVYQLQPVNHWRVPEDIFHTGRHLSFRNGSDVYGGNERRSTRLQSEERCERSSKLHSGGKLLGLCTLLICVLVLLRVPHVCASMKERAILSSSCRVLWSVKLRSMEPMWLFSCR